MTMHGILRRVATVAIVLGGWCATAHAGDGDTWKLRPTLGHKPNVWAAGPNWKHADGNPLSDAGATWTLATQAEKEPSLTSAYKLMTAGTYVDYTFAWLTGPATFDPGQRYVETMLITSPEDAAPQTSRSSAILLKVPQAGAYKAEIAGTVYVQNVTAGHALLTLYTLNADRSVAKELKSFQLNKKADGAFGDFPEKFDYSDTVQLGAGEELAVRIQAVNPGTASAGRCGATFSNFTVTLEKK